MARYVTLEHGMDILEEGTHTVLCEWAGDNHLNMGVGPEPTVDAFAGKLSEMVSSRGRLIVAALYARMENDRKGP